MGQTCNQNKEREEISRVRIKLNQQPFNCLVIPFNKPITNYLCGLITEI